MKKNNGTTRTGKVFVLDIQPSKPRQRLTKAEMLEAKARLKAMGVKLPKR